MLLPPSSTSNSVTKLRKRRAEEFPIDGRWVTQEVVGRKVNLIYSPSKTCDRISIMYAYLLGTDPQERAEETPSRNNLGTEMERNCWTKDKLVASWWERRRSYECLAQYVCPSFLLVVLRRRGVDDTVSCLWGTLACSLRVSIFLLLAGRLFARVVRGIVKLAQCH